MYLSSPNCYVFVCPPCTPPELEIIQVKHKDHCQFHVLNYIIPLLYIARSGTLSRRNSFAACSEGLRDVLQNLETES